MDCGNPSISTEACYKLGCCYDARDLTCYYKLNGENVVSDLHGDVISHSVSFLSSSSVELVLK